MYVNKYIKFDEVLYSYSGTLSNDLITSFTLNIEDRLNQFEPKIKSLNKLLIIVIELLQNMNKYAKIDSISKEIITNNNLINISKDKENGKIYIICSNNISFNSKEVISSRIDKINQMNDLQMKEYYSMLRKNATYLHEKGAGFGFVEIARKAEGNLEYSFDEVNSNLVFSLKVTLKQ